MDVTIEEQEMLNEQRDLLTLEYIVKQKWSQTSIEAYAAAFGFEEKMAGQILGHLVNKGLVTRIQDPGSVRFLRYRITDAGLQCLEQTS